MKRLAALALSLALAFSLNATALAASPNNFTIIKTDIEAHYVDNYDGYGGIYQWSPSETYRGDPIVHSALVDPYGNFLRPYTLNESKGVLDCQFVCSEGFLTISQGDLANWRENARYYNLDGTTAFELPHIREELQAQVSAENTDPNFEPTVKVSFWLSPFQEGVAVVREKYTCRLTAASEDETVLLQQAYLMDTQGQILGALPEEYAATHPEPHSEELFLINIGRSSEGLISVQSWTTELESFVGYLDHTGHLALYLPHMDYGMPFSDGLACVRETDDETGRFGFIDHDGNWAISPQYSHPGSFVHGLFPISGDPGWGAIDRQGNLVIPCQYYTLENTDSGYLIAATDWEHYGMIDPSNNWVIPPDFHEITPFVNGVAYAIKDHVLYIIKDNTAAIAYTSPQTLSIDGENVSLRAYALKDETGNPTNYVKLRDIAHLLNGSAAQFNVGWDGNVNILTNTPYEANGSELSTPFTGDRAYTIPTSSTNIDGKTADLAAIVLTDDDGGAYTYYQLRDLGKALGFNVGWSADQGIFIETDQPYTDAN